MFECFDHNPDGNGCSTNKCTVDVMLISKIVRRDARRVSGYDYIEGFPGHADCLALRFDKDAVCIECFIDGKGVRIWTAN